MKYSKLSILTLLATISSVCAAEDTNKDYFFQFNAGYAKGKASGLVNKDFQNAQGTNSKYTNSGLVGIEFGTNLHDNFRTSLSADYFTGFDFNSSFKDSAQTSQGLMKNKFQGKVNIKSSVLMLNGYYDITTINDFIPYVTLGLGISRNEAKASFARNPGVLGEGSDKYKSKIEYAFAYKIGLGSQFKLNEDFNLDLRYQYSNLGKYRTGTGDDGVGGKIEPIKGKLVAHQIILGVAYKF